MFLLGTFKNYFKHWKFNVLIVIIIIVSGDDDMFGVPLMIMANKQDLPQALSPVELADKLGLSHVKNRQWRVQGTCATNGDGIYESIIDFSKMVKAFQNQILKHDIV